MSITDGVRAGAAPGMMSAEEFKLWKQVVLPLFLVQRDGAWSPLGTAFVVAQVNARLAFAVTATHNVLYAHRLSRRGVARHASAIAEFMPEPPDLGLDGFHVNAILQSGGQGLVATMRMAWWWADIDVALIELTLSSEIDVNVGFASSLAVDISPAIAVETPVFAAGYGSMGAEWTSPPDYEKEDFQVTVDMRLEFRGGKVLGPGASVLGKSAGFLVSCPFDSGMSGGPVIEMRGNKPVVRGLVSSDVSENAESGTTGSGLRAFASYLTHMGGYHLAGRRILHEGEVLASPRVIDMIRIGAIEDHGEAASRLLVDPDPQKCSAIWRW